MHLEVNMGHCEKVRIFTSSGTQDNFSALESEVNKWLAETPIEITQRQVTGSSVALEDRLYVICTIVIFYFERTTQHAERIPIEE